MKCGWRHTGAGVTRCLSLRWGALLLLSLVAVAGAQAPETPTAPQEVGVLLGDSILQGFGGSPVVYSEWIDYFREDRYRFKPESDKRVEPLIGYKGLDLWLNRGVVGNSSKSVSERWRKDVIEKQDRGLQTKTQVVKWVIVSAGITDIGAAVGTGRMLQVESKLRQNLLTLAQRAKTAKIRIAFFELPDPTCAPLGKSFTDQSGATIPSFCEKNQYSPAQCEEFTGAVQRTRTFMERYLPPAGAEVIDYARILPSEYFADAVHPNPAGYWELGRTLLAR